MDKNTLAELFPLTSAQIRDELIAARERLLLLEHVSRQFNLVEKESHQFEVVIPKEAPYHIQGRSKGPDLKVCNKEAIKQSGRKGPSYAFAILEDGVAVALSVEDVAKSRISRQASETRPLNKRIVWTKTDRGYTWFA